MDNLLTKLVDFIFPHQQDFNGNEKIFWDNHWCKMSQYYEKHGEIFEIRDKWDFYCNEALYNHYKLIVKDFRNLKCIEYGCGGGYESSLMAKDGAEVTILDYSERALEYAKIVSQKVGVLNQIKFVNSDIFDFYTKEKYDLAWNCGVIEHYQDSEIVRITKKMMNFTRRGGLVVVTIPNLLSPQSIYWMLTTGKGSERYISYRRLKILMEKAGLKHVKIKNFNYWLPSFLPVEWAIEISRNKLLNNFKTICWLFSGVGIKI